MSQTLIEPEWDGHQLVLRIGAQTRVRIRIDGSCFCNAVADDDGFARLQLPFSPTGNAYLRLSVSWMAGNEVSNEFAVDVEMGRPGIHEASGSNQRLRALGARESLVAFDAEPMQRGIAIVVPIYNAPADVARCLGSVLARTTGAARLILIDDASTDAQITPLLERYRGINGVEIFTNSKNLGFTATVNRGIALAGEADVVLLNADTEVAANWLTGLRRALYSSDDIATVTAVSDNAGAFSVPELERENPLPGEWTFAETALALWQNAGLAYPELPTGNGFCMLIRREVINAIGAFDVEAFPQGYGEENDFCQRACAAGYRHVIAGNVLVRHARSRSFGHERRKALGVLGMQVLRERWPRYEADVGAHLFSFERRVLDWRVRRLYTQASEYTPKPRALCLGFDGELALASGYDTLMLNPSNFGLELLGSDREPLEKTTALDTINSSQWLQRHAIDVVLAHKDCDQQAVAILESVSRRLGIAFLCGVEHSSALIEACDMHVDRQRSFAESRR